MNWIAPELLSLFSAQNTDAHRLFSFQGGWVERLGADILISYKNDQARDEMLSGFKEWQERVNFRCARIYGRFLPKQNAERVSPFLIEGEAGATPAGVVVEAGVHYGVDFSAGYSAGLFLDQRANRAYVRQRAPKRLLNTFAYTCSFSVVAALAGAQTLSVDLSKKSLDRGRANFELNGLPLEGHRFMADDVLDLLPRLVRRGETFDAIILDPPTFSRGNRGRRWQVEQGMEELVLAAFELLAPEGAMLLSTNCTKLNRRSLELIARFALKRHRRAGSLHQEPGLPDFGPGEGAQTLWLLAD